MVQTTRQDKATTAWSSLNERQQVYLRAIYVADQAVEESRKLSAARGHYSSTPAAVWRWLLYATLSTGDTDLKSRLRSAGIDEGTGSTFAALEKRGLVQTQAHDRGTSYEGQLTPNHPQQWYLFVKITPAGRAAARAGDPAYTPIKPLPKGTLKERQWAALEALYNAGEAGLPQDAIGNYGGFSWQWTMLRLRDYKPQALAAEANDFRRDGQRIYKMVITPFGRQYYEENRQRYAELYPSKQAGSTD